MKLHKTIFFLTLTVFIMSTGLVYSQDIVIPADTEDIEAFDNALMKQMNQAKNNKDNSYATDSVKKKNEEKIEEEISKEAKKMKNLNEKSRNKMKNKIEEKAHANMNDMSPKGSQNAADVVSPPHKNAASSPNP